MSKTPSPAAVCTLHPACHPFGRQTLLSPSRCTSGKVLSQALWECVHCQPLEVIDPALLPCSASRCSVVAAGNPWFEFVTSRHLPEFVDVLVTTVVSVYLTSYVTLPACAILFARWTNTPRPRYREPWRTIDEGFACLRLNQQSSEGESVAPSDSRRSVAADKSV